MSHHMLSTTVRASLQLEDGSIYYGWSFGHESSVAGEAVFSTGMVGYPEAITDPSFSGQLLVVTYPIVGSYGVPSHTEVDHNGLVKHFESNRIHVSALIVGDYCGQYSHWRAVESLADWLKRENVPAIFGVDTRAITKRIRDHGSMLGKIIVHDADVPFMDPNKLHLVAEVSCKESKVYQPNPTSVVPGQKPLRILAVDCGMKFNQIRCFTNRGVELTVVPWNFDYMTGGFKYDGLFISNGPGDPTQCTETIAILRQAIQQSSFPIFGICLGHQLMSLAAGARTSKLKFGNRAHNIPCVDRRSGRCFITTQNHGFAVDVSSLPEDWEELFYNANDNTNEGIIHKSKPFFSVQFHPESAPGPRDSEFLFDYFLASVTSFRETQQLSPLPAPERLVAERIHVSKVLVLGSGGLSIGQAGEFDYSGSQAIKSLKQEGISTVLINPNIATIQTSAGLADKVYFLPVTPEFVLRVIDLERPDGILVTFGGQTALNCGIKIKGELLKRGVRVLGTPIETIEWTEDREVFAQKMREIGEPVAMSAAATSFEEAVSVARKISYPVICRAAFALGGLGSGFANNDAELRELTSIAFASSPQVLIERSMKGWKEIEYEVVRDCVNNCITVCNMENFDPLGVHTGDSIVVAPSQTLSDREYHMLRDSAIKCIRHLGVVGECNIQFALNPESEEYCIIEVNARLSRSSALASKATGYPLAFVAAKLALNIPLTSIKNSVTKVTCACFEPSLDYIVCKVPRWDLKKFDRVSTKISSSMKSVGEVMSISRSFEEGLQKAIRALDDSLDGFQGDKTDLSTATIDDELANPTDQRLFVLAKAMEVHGYDVERVHALSNIDRWFLHKLQRIINLRSQLKTVYKDNLSVDVLKYAKQLGFSDKQIAQSIDSTALAVRALRLEHNIMPLVKQIDTVAAEFPAYTNYLYTTYSGTEYDIALHSGSVIVLGSGVYRIGSSVEFDWCAVRAIRTLRANGIKTIMVNYNPETVSTDYDEADRLYFENITLETILDINLLESASGVIMAMGGQVPNNIAMPLFRQNVRILGTSPVEIDMAENRYKFSRLLDTMGVHQPLWKELTNLDEAARFCAQVEYPVLVRPSYVLSGAAMAVVYSQDDLGAYLREAAHVSREHPVVISKYIAEAKEIDVDCVAHDGELVMHLISEHVENAGVHSGDATLLQPPQDLDEETSAKLLAATKKIVHALRVTGPCNIQFIAKNKDILVIECNVRASRSFPFVSKTSGVDMIELATKVIMDLPYEAYPLKNYPRPGYVGVKVPLFSFSRLQGADPVLGVEMASTGEVACFGADRFEAYLKALFATGFKLPPPNGNILLSVGSFREKKEFLPSALKLVQLGFKLFATPGTADYYREHDVAIAQVDFFEQGSEEELIDENYSLDKKLTQHGIDMYICFPSMNSHRRPASYMSRGYKTRRLAVDRQIPLITNIKCAKLLIEGMARYSASEKLPISDLDCQGNSRAVSLPTPVNLSWSLTADGIADAASLKGGFTLTTVVTDLLSTQEELSSALTKFSVQESSAADFAVLARVALSPSIASAASHSEIFAGLALDFIDPTPAALDFSVLLDTFRAVSNRRPVLVRANGNNLALVLLAAQVSRTAVHISNVQTAFELALIQQVRCSGAEISCDIDPVLLFIGDDQLVQYQTIVGGSTVTRADIDSFWSNIDTIDSFAPRSEFVEHSLLLLLAAVSENRLTLDQLITKLSVNPLQILRVSPTRNTQVEVNLANQSTTAPSTVATVLRGCRFGGKIERVVVRNTVVVAGNSVVKSVPSGLNCKSPMYTSTIVEGASSAVPRSVSRSLSSAAVATSVPASTGNLTLKETSSVAIPSVLSPAPPARSAPIRSERNRTISVDATSVRPAAVLEAVDASNLGHLLSVKGISRNDLHTLFRSAAEMRTIVERFGTVDFLKNKILATVFYEPSTRTHCSFTAAMQRLGGQCIDVCPETSSIRKGETVADTIRCVECYADGIVIRHPQKGAVQEGAKYASVPIINGGDGIGEHPTQALLDLYTIREELGTVNGLTITFVGDLANGRTTHSLARLLKLYEVKLNFVSHSSLRMPESVRDELHAAGIRFHETSDLDSVMPETDALYVTRIQRERFESDETYQSVKSLYCITPKTLTIAKTRCIIMHPLPRVDEISPEVDFDPRAVYFRQMKYGLYVRMAILFAILGKRN